MNSGDDRPRRNLLLVSVPRDFMSLFFFRVIKKGLRLLLTLIPLNPNLGINEFN